MGVKSMSEAERYRAFRNFMFNELGVTKDDIRTWITEAVRQQAAQVQLEDRVERAVAAEIDHSVREAVRHSLQMSAYDRGSTVVDRAIAKVIAERITVSLKPAE